MFGSAMTPKVKNIHFPEIHQKGRTYNGIPLFLKSYKKGQPSRGGVPFIDELKYYSVVTTVQPSGMPLTPVTFQVADGFFTKVPVEETPETQFDVNIALGSSVNSAFM